MKARIPLPAVERLAVMHTVLERLEENGQKTISSAELGELLDVQPHTVRKDISFLGQAGDESGYSVTLLKRINGKVLGFDTQRKACIVGLGRLGSSILHYSGFSGSSIRVVAGFDSSINRIETLRTSVPLYPAYRIAEIVKNRGIEIGVIAVPASSAQVTLEKLEKGGILGIINFAPVVLKPDAEKVVVRNMHLLEEFRVVSALIRQE